MNNSDYRNCDFCCKRFYKDEVLHCSLTNEEKTDSDVCKAYDADPIKIETYKRAEVKSIDVSEKNKHNIGVIVGIIVTVFDFLLLLYLVESSYSTISINNLLILVLIGISLTLSILLFLRTRKIPVKKFEKKVIRYFKEEGYACEKKDGILYARVKGHTYSIYLWDTDNPRIKRFSLLYDFVPKHMEEIKFIGWHFLACYTNMHNQHTTTVIYPNEFVRCKFVSAVSNIKDFESEFRNGDSLIRDSVKFFFDYFNSTKYTFPAENVKPAKVGFNVEAF